MSQLHGRYPSAICTLSMGAIGLLIGVTGCVSVPISYYDATTYTQLTSLKAETTTLVESFDTKPYPENRKAIEDTTLTFRKAYEYEKGKGNPNSDTTQQFEIIYGLFMSAIEEYKEHEPRELGKTYFREKARLLGQAFDTAIATENLKNKDKR